MTVLIQIEKSTLRDDHFWNVSNFNLGYSTSRILAYLVLASTTGQGKAILSAPHGAALALAAV